ncbi:galactose oxidase-like domain-containing protein [Variovorax sp. M-6]|uniref:galactose oxidase-like domain-containing protein n=1 Tax=Variovorax sp. M-6 TaxID=3233041 RepID=UPI003F981DF4
MSSVPSGWTGLGLVYASLAFLTSCGGGDGSTQGMSPGSSSATTPSLAAKREDAFASAGKPTPPPDGQAAVLSSPTPGSKLSGRSTTFAWSDTGANQYGLTIQSPAGAAPLYDTVTSATAVTVANLPVNGAEIVVTLRSRSKGKWLAPNEYRFTAAGYTAAQSTAAIKPWSDPIALPLVPAAAAHLPDGKLLMWAARSPTSFTTSSSDAYTYTTVFDPATQTSSSVSVTATGHQMFCPGLSMLADGSVLVSGGSDAAKTSLYDPATGVWAAGAQLGIARAYHSSTTLSDGSVFLVGGSWNGGQGGKSGELWSASTRTWRTLSSVPADMPSAANASNPPLGGPDAAGVYRGDNHMWLFGVADGWVFHGGPAAAMHWIDTRGSGAIVQAGPRSDDPYAMTASAVMYDPGRILKLGGAPNHDSGNAFNTAYIIDINAGPPNPATVRKVSPMAYGRTFVNSVVLPNGEVVVMGGQTQPVPFSDAYSVLAAELWSPATESFITLPPMQKPRNYHSVALLLMDGRVLSGGGGLCACDGDHLDVEIYTPPYLLAPDGSPAPRPAITAAPATATWGSQIAVRTDRAVARFALVRMTSVTHSVNTDQRRIPLSFTGTDGNYQLSIPAQRGVVLPGNHMLFALDAKGAPSVARTLNIR